MRNGDTQRRHEGPRRHSEPASYGPRGVGSTMSCCASRGGGLFRRWDSGEPCMALSGRVFGFVQHHECPMHSLCQVRKRLRDSVQRKAWPVHKTEGRKSVLLRTNPRSRRMPLDSITISPSRGPASTGPCVSPPRMFEISSLAAQTRSARKSLCLSDFPLRAGLAQQVHNDRLFAEPGTGQERA